MASPEPLRFDDGPGGFACLGALAPAAAQCVQAAWQGSLQAMGPQWARLCDAREVFWTNLWQHGQDDEPAPDSPQAELHRIACALNRQAFGAQAAYLDGYGFIVNPCGSAAQDWHVDYHWGTAGVFVPLTRLTERNAVQYALLPPAVDAATRQRLMPDLDCIDLDALVQACGYVSVRQLLAPPLHILRMDFGTIHRAVANRGDDARIMFWISSNLPGVQVVREPRVQKILRPVGLAVAGP